MSDSNQLKLELTAGGDNTEHASVTSIYVPHAWPVGKRVLVLPMQADEKTPGGLHIPVESRARAEEQKIGQVIAIGPDVPATVLPQDSVGKNIFYNNYGGLPYKDRADDGSFVDLMFLASEHIVGIIDD